MIAPTLVVTIKTHNSNKEYVTASIAVMFINENRNMNVASRVPIPAIVIVRIVVSMDSGITENR